MADVSEKHIEAARAAFHESIKGPAGDEVSAIARALANAEREGMKRAEAICHARSKDHRKQAKKYESEGDEASQTQCWADAVEAMYCASDIRLEVVQV